MKEEIIEETEDKNIKLFRVTCKYCNQEIKGNSKIQVKYLLIQHKLAKHKDKLKITEVK